MTLNILFFSGLNIPVCISAFDSWHHTKAVLWVPPMNNVLRNEWPQNTCALHFCLRSSAFLFSFLFFFFCYLYQHVGSHCEIMVSELFVLHGESGQLSRGNGIYPNIDICDIVCLGSIALSPRNNPYISMAMWRSVWITSRWQQLLYGK